MKNDDLVEEFVPEDGEGNTQSQATRLKEKLKEAEDKAKEYLDSWQRAQADFVNLRKRDEEEMKNREKYAAGSFINEVIPVLQSLEIASGVDKNAEAIYSQLNAVMKKIGVSVIDPMGEKFDPNLHEAIKTTKTDEKEKDHTVSEVLEKGFMLHDRVLRPAKVAVFSHE